MELSEIRNRIDAIDEPLLDLFLERMALCREVAEYKKGNNLPVMNEKREREILEKVVYKSGDLAEYAKSFYSTIFELSRSYQKEIISNQEKLL